MTETCARSQNQLRLTQAADEGSIPMTVFRTNDNRVALRSVALSALAGVVGAGAMLALTAMDAPAQGPAKDKIPELASSQFAWLAAGADWRDPPAGMRGPIQADPEHPRHFNLDGPGQVTFRLGNYKDPVLKPWAAEKIRQSNEEVLTGKRDLPFAAQARCYPGGVPGQLLYPAEPFYFIQKPQQVWMIWQRDQMVRRISLTDKHSANVKPSRFGESIGRYENGDTLVIDTIGISPHINYIDNYRTPHTEKLHVQERIKIAADGATMEALVKVEDPDTFNEPLYMVQRWRKVPNPLLETVCAENNVDFFYKNLFPIPTAAKPDF